jgi:thiamine-monophosphate kinase
MNEHKSEFELIDWIRRHRQPPDRNNVITDIGDDMAVVQIGGEKLLITTDILLDGVHFELSQVSPVQVGYKAMACSLSDCAAMAALPFVAVVAVALPQDMTMDQARQLYDGLQRPAIEYNCPIIGGDTTSWNKPLAVDVTMLAKPGPKPPILRSGAQVGDAIMVTGRLGGSLHGKHLQFTPRVNEAQTLTQMAELHAMIDISDGLSSDLRHICRQSNVNAIIDANAIPLSDAVKNCSDPLTAALTDGEDFELLFCLSPHDAANLLRTWPRHSDLELSQIGQITSLDHEHRIMLRQPDGTTEPLTAKGWEHFCD